MINRVLFGCALFVALLFVPVATGKDPQARAIDSKVDRLLETLRDRQDVPGVSVALGRDGRVVFAKAYGVANVEHQVPATTDTLFRTASICKTFTAIAALQLSEAGKLDLDEPVAAIFPELKQENWTFTSRQLLSHQAGVRHYKSRSESMSTAHFPDVQSALTTFLNDPLLHPPGSAYRYSSFGYNLLGAIVERRSGQSYDEYLDGSIERVAGMQQTRVDNHYEIIPHRSAGYILAKPKDKAALAARRYLKPGNLYNAAMHDTSVKVPGGGMLSTPTDLVRFASAVMEGKLVGRDTMNAMWTKQRTTTGEETQYGLGFRLYLDDPQLVVGHSGGQAGVATLLVMSPSTGDSAAVMCNLENTKLHEVAMSLLAIAGESAQSTNTEAPGEP